MRRFPSSNAGADTALSVAGTVDLVAPGHVRVLKPAATWPSITAAASSESNAPHFELVVLDEARCGDVLTLAFDGTSSNSPSFSAAIDLPMGIPNRDYSETAIVIIPPLTASPAIATWNVTDDKTIRDLDVTLDIFHQDPDADHRRADLTPGDDGPPARSRRRQRSRDRDAIRSRHRAVRSRNHGRLRRGIEAG